MKKTKLFNLVLGVLFFHSVSLFSQVDYQHTITVNAGGSLIGLVLDIADQIDGENLEINSIPAIQAAYDYRINEWFSVGPAASYQAFVFKGEDYQYTDESGEEVTVDAKVTIGRTNLAVRPLFHYGKNPQLDMYSGLRLGTTFLNARANGESEDIQEDFEGAFNTGISVQVIPFGLRGYFNENFGLNMEIALGAPHIISGGVNYRF